MEHRPQSVRMMAGLLVFVPLVSLMPTGALSAQTPASVKISEIRIDQPSTDNDEYFELVGEAGTALGGLTYLVIGDCTGDSGVIGTVVDLAGRSLRVATLWLLRALSAWVRRI